MLVLSIAHPVTECQKGAKLLYNNYNKIWPTSSQSPLPEALQPSKVAGSNSDNFLLTNICGNHAPIKEYRSCKGSKPYSRGYTCGLWTLFHSLTVNAPDKPGVGRLVLDGIANYLRYDKSDKYDEECQTFYPYKYSHRRWIQFCLPGLTSHAQHVVITSSR